MFLNSLDDLWFLYNKHIVNMSNLPESVYFEQELCLLLLMAWMQWLDTLYYQGICWRSRIGCLARTAGVRSCLGVLVDYRCPTLTVIHNWYCEHTTGCEASNDEDSASECSSGSLAGCWGGVSVVAAWFWRLLSTPAWCRAEFANQQLCWLHW